MTFFPKFPYVHENSERELNLMSSLLYLYLSKSAFLVSLTAQNKQLSSVEYVFKSFYHESNIYEIYKSITFL